MESSLLLRYVHFPTARARVPCAMAPTLAAKAYPAYAHFASQIPKKSITFSPITCALNLNGLAMLPSSFSQSENKIDHKNKTSGVLLGASLVLACVIGIFNCSCRINPCLANDVKAAFGSYSAKDALGALLEYSYKQEKTQIWRKETAAEARNHAIEVVKLGQGSAAIKHLESKLKEAKTKLESELQKSTASSESDVDDTVIYELYLALVEVLIILGSYEDAIKNLEQFGRSDPRTHLYKAIALTMLARDDEKAKKCWIDFITSIGKSVAEESPPATAVKTDTSSLLPPERGRRKG